MGPNFCTVYSTHCSAIATRPKPSPIPAGTVHEPSPRLNCLPATTIASALNTTQAANAAPSPCSGLTWAGFHMCCTFSDRR